MLSIRGLQPPTNALRLADQQVSQSVSRLSSGLRIQRASDDAAGLEISHQLETQTRGDYEATRNIQSALNFIKVGQDGIGIVIDVLQRMRELTVQAGNSTIGAAAANAINAELTELTQSVLDAKQVAIDARFNFQAPVGARFVTYQIGANFGQTVTFDFNPLAAVLTSFLVSSLTLNVSTTTAADSARTVIDTAISGIETTLSKLGGFSNMLEHALDDVSGGKIAQETAMSRLRDADMANELVTLSRAQIISASSFNVVKLKQQHTQVLATLLYGS